MTSQLNVDTIVDKAGSGGTNVKIGNTSVTVAEGGSATTTTVQGLAKAFSSINGASTAATRGTFNMSSLNDTGTGQYTITITNPMANTNYTGHFSSGDHDDTADSFTRQFIHTLNTANISVFIAQTAGSYYDTTYIGCTIHGDLA